MTVFKATLPDLRIALLTRDVGLLLIATAVHHVRPGEKKLGLTYDQWAALPDGSNKIEGPEPWA